jgi:hypothetical protein
MNKCSIVEATHVLYKGTTYRIASKWGMSPGERLAKPSQGGFGCVTDTGLRISMWDAEAYFEETQEKPFMSLWTIYDSPTDFPGKFVARRHDIFRDRKEPQVSEEHFVADSLDEIRNLIPFGLACLTRSEEDDAKIVETWL